MSDVWKAFWRGVLSAFAAIGTAFGLIAVLRRKTPIETPEKIALETKEKIDAVRIDIKNDSDEELKNRFNALAKKQKRKADER